VATDVIPFSSRTQLAERQASSGQPFVRESYSPGANRSLPWRDTRDDLRWRARAWRTALEAGGVTRADRVLHALPSASAVAQDCWSAAVELGARSLATELATTADVLRFRPTVLVSTPTDVLRLGQAAVEQNVVLTDRSLALVVVTGEPGGSLSGIRRRIAEHFGARCLDVYQLTEAGVVGWGCIAGDGIHLNEDEFAVESIDPDGDRPVDDAQMGELVISTRTARGTPLVRYRTGDLAQISPAPCVCGSASVRAAGGVRGRLSDRLRVRGIELLPWTIEQIVRRHPAVVEYRLKVYQVRGESELGVQIEPDGAIASEGDLARVASEVAADLRRSLGLRLQCDVAVPGSLNDQDAGRRARRLSRQ